MFASFHFDCVFSSIWCQRFVTTNMSLLAISFSSFAIFFGFIDFTVWFRILFPLCENRLMMVKMYSCCDLLSFVFDCSCVFFLWFSFFPLLWFKLVMKMALGARCNVTAEEHRDEARGGSSRLSRRERQSPLPSREFPARDLRSRHFGFGVRSLSSFRAALAWPHCLSAAPPSRPRYVGLVLHHRVTRLLVHDAGFRAAVRGKDGNPSGCG